MSVELERGALDELADRWRAGWQGSGFERCCTPDVSYEDPVAVDPLRRVEPDIACAGDRAPRGMRETRDRTQHGRLAGSRRADERDRLAADVER